MSQIPKSIKKLIKYIIRLPFLVYLKFFEHTFEGRIKYLLFRRKSSVWIVVFSAFDSTNRIRLYNYVKSLSKLNANFIFLSDPYGYRGSYYLLENGNNTPELQTQRLINQIIPPPPPVRLAQKTMCATPAPSYV